MTPKERSYRSKKMDRLLKVVEYGGLALGGLAAINAYGALNSIRTGELECLQRTYEHSIDWLNFIAPGGIDKLHEEAVYGLYKMLGAAQWSFDIFQNALNGAVFSINSLITAYAARRIRDSEKIMEWSGKRFYNLQEKLGITKMKSYVRNGIKAGISAASGLVFYCLGPIRTGGSSFSSYDIICDKNGCVEKLIESRHVDPHVDPVASLIFTAILFGPFVAYYAKEAIKHYRKQDIWVYM